MGDYAERAWGHVLLLASVRHGAKKIRVKLGTPYFAALSWAHERSFVWLSCKHLEHEQGKQGDRDHDQ
jgi:hypothetical protein